MKTRSTLVKVSPKYVLSNKEVTGERKYVYFYNELEDKFLFAKEPHMAQEFTLDEVRDLVVAHANLQLSATLLNRI